MSRLTKWIESLQKKVIIKEAVTSASVYYKVNGTKIRISDHFAETNNTAHLQVVIPFNSRTVYLVRIKEGANIMTFTFAECKQFISNYLMIRAIAQQQQTHQAMLDDIRKEKQVIEEPKKEVKQESKSESDNLNKLLGFNADDCTLRIKEVNYTKICKDIKRQLHLRIGDLNQKKRRLIRTCIIGRNITYREVIETLKEAKDKKVLKGSYTNLENWFLNKFN